jgi:hypothetical protein
VGFLIIIIVVVVYHVFVSLYASFLVAKAHVPERRRMEKRICPFALSPFPLSLF